MLLTTHFLLGVVNIVSEHFIEAANVTSINAPYGVSEFDISGLHPADARHVQAPRIKEAVFSIEAKLVEIREYKSKLSPSLTKCVMAVVEGVNFWAREDAIDEQRSLLDLNVSKLALFPTFDCPPFPSPLHHIAKSKRANGSNSRQVLRPMARLGGITYSRLTDLVELPRPEWDKLSAEEKSKFSHPN
jgi:Flavin reductase like domain